MSTATAKQTDYILRLAGVQFLSQVPGLSQRQARGGLTQVEASQIIEELLQAKAPDQPDAQATEPVPFIEGAMPATAILDALDRWVTLTTAKNPEQRTMRLNRIQRHDNGNIVLVSIDKAGQTVTIAIKNVTSWRVEG